MKNKRALAVTLIGFGFLTAGILAQESKTASSGKDVYTQKCGSCHGKQGEGVAKMATILKTKIADLRGKKVTSDTLSAWKKVTSDGKGKMPAFKSKLSAAEIDSALAHMQFLAKVSAREAKPDSAKGVK